jgi:hypothetical protein
VPGQTLQARRCGSRVKDRQRDRQHRKNYATLPQRLPSSPFFAHRQNGTLQAKALFEALAETDEVKAASTSRERRLRLQVSYGQAVMWAKGQAAEETKAVLARADELATEMGEFELPLDAWYARFAHALWRGELGSTHETAERFLREAERAARPTEAAAAHRCLAACRT